jgi:hypothetical protein
LFEARAVCLGALPARLALIGFLERLLSRLSVENQLRMPTARRGGGDDAYFFLLPFSLPPNHQLNDRIRIGLGGAHFANFCSASQNDDPVADLKDVDQVV